MNESDYHGWLQFHQGARQGERRRRLQERHGHAEHLFIRKVWWPTFGTFDSLHPEYEIRDFRDTTRFVDFAYVRPNGRIAIEIDGFGPHQREVDRWQFSDQLRRQNQLVLDGWIVLRFSFDDVLEHPKVCQQTLQQLWGKLFAAIRSDDPMNVYEREILRFSARTANPVTPSDICTLLDVRPALARKLLRGLVEKRWLETSSGTIRMRTYTLHPSRHGQQRMD